LGIASAGKKERRKEETNEHVIDVLPPQPDIPE